ncbi:MAG: hypothetical protein U1E76_14800 [Planctomycetota bacterium]
MVAGCPRAYGSAGNPTVQNALLESFAIHVRVLVAFFYDDPNPSRPDDVLAEEYFVNPATWRDGRPACPEPLVRVRSRTGKEVAHLTYVRASVVEKEPPFAEIVRALDRVVARFTELRRGEKSPEVALDERFEKAADAMRRSLRESATWGAGMTLGASPPPPPGWGS